MATIAILTKYMDFKVADLCDVHISTIRVAFPLFHDFGGYKTFSGKISTVKCFEDNSLVKAALMEPGAGKVLVVDGNGSHRCALLGDLLAASAVKNAWAGIIVYGCIRDSSEILQMKIGLKALAACPMKSEKSNTGERDILVEFAGVSFVPGEYVYVDKDGIIVNKQSLL